MTEVFYNVLPYLLAIGMPYDLFWFGEPELVGIYQKAYRQRNRDINQQLWIEGLYICRAVHTIDGKSKYPSEPFDIFPKTEEEKKRDAEKDKQAIIDYFSSLKQRWENGNNR